MYESYTRVYERSGENFFLAGRGDGGLGRWRAWGAGQGVASCWFEGGPFIFADCAWGEGGTGAKGAKSAASYSSSSSSSA